ncbi:MAG: hypothetical protein OEN52_01150 [Gammaproteobacteria bacterium]|nr:hypothetical protein [Gammaproteobacteria bacterium]
MRSSKRFLAGLTLAALLFSVVGAAFAADVKPNKKRGQVYFRMVCTACHVDLTGAAIPPAGRTMAEWRAYLDADKHDASGKTNPSARYYISHAYRESIKDHNKAAKKFLKLPDEQLYADIYLFAVNGAKDSDTPATCN